MIQAGENIKKLSPKLKKKHPEIDWKGLTGMRDIIVHGYHRVDLEEVRITIKEEIPVLKEVCKKIMNKH